MKRYDGITAQAISAARRFVLETRYALWTSTFFLLTGISTGVFLEIVMKAGEKNNLAANLLQHLFTDRAQIDFINPFLSSAAGNLIFILIIFLSGLSVLGFPVAWLTLTYKGMTLGFSAGLLLQSVKTKGVVTLFVSLVPQNLILLPALIAAAAAATSYALLALSRRRASQKKNAREDSSAYAYLMVGLALLVLIGCGVEAILYSGYI